MEPITNLCAALKVYFFLFKILGLCCYNIDKNTLYFEFKFKIFNFYSLVIPILLLSAYFYYFVNCVDVEDNDDWKFMTTIDKYALQVNQYLTAIQYLMHFLFFHFYRKKIARLFQSSYNIEKMLSKLLNKTDFKSVYNFGWQSILLFTGLIISIFSIHLFIPSYGMIIIFFLLFIPCLVNDLFLCFLGVLLFDVRCKFVLVNNNVIRLIDVSNTTRLMQLGELVEIYDKLRKYCLEINNIFNFYIGGWFLNCMFNIILPVYFLIFQVQRNSRHLYILLWSFYVSFKIIYAVYNFNCVRNKVNNKYYINICLFQ